MEQLSSNNQQPRLNRAAQKQSLARLNQPRLLSRRAQLFSMDIMIAVLLVVIFVSIVAVNWNSNVEAINTRQARMEMQRTAYDSGNDLVRLKLVNETNVFDTKKLLDFVDTNYTISQEDLGVSGYDFYFKLVYPGNETIIPIGETGLVAGKHYENATDIIIVRRIGVLNNQEAIAYLYIWT